MKKLHAISPPYGTDDLVLQYRSVLMGTRFQGAMVLLDFLKLVLSFRHVEEGTMGAENGLESKCKGSLIEGKGLQIVNI